MKQTVSLNPRLEINLRALRPSDASLFAFGVVASIASFFISVYGSERLGAAVGFAGLSALLLISDKKGGEK